MSTQKLLPTRVPNLFLDQWVDKDGYLSNGAREFLSQLINSLQQMLTPEGFRLPGQIGSNLSSITVPGALLYNTTTDKAEVNLAGVFHEIVTL